MTTSNGNGSVQSRKKQDEILAGLEKEWGTTAFVRTSLGLLVCRKPTPGEYKRFQDKASDPKKTSSSAAKEFVMQAVVHPEADAAMSIFSSYPALYDGLAVAMHNLSGGDLEIETGKSRASG